MSDDVATRDAILASQHTALRADILSMRIKASILKTIASGAITFSINQTFLRVDTESGAGSDDLNTINDGNEGQVVILIQANSSHEIVVKHNTGNIILGGTEDLILSGGKKTLTLLKQLDGKYHELMRGGIPGGGSAPSGTIALLAGSCPSGWTRFAALDNKYPKGAASYGGTGGAASHAHTYTEILAHTHDTGTLACASGGAHTHKASFKDPPSGGSYPNWTNNKAYQDQGTTSSAGAHTHTLSGNTASTGSATANTQNTDNLPPSLDMVFCQKD